MRIAVTSSDGENVDLHFGKGNSLYVYDYNEENEDLSFLEHRTVAIEEDKKEQSYLIIKAIEDCDVAICRSQYKTGSGRRNCERSFR